MPCESVAHAADRSCGASSDGGDGACAISSDGNNGGQHSIRRTASAPALKAAAAPPPHSGRGGTAGTSTPSCAPCAAAAPSRAEHASTRLEGCMDVFVVARAFSEFGGPVLARLPPNAKQSLLDIGVCHYMTVFVTPSGDIHQFDFGPRGGDVHIASVPFAGALRRARSAAAIAGAGAGALGGGCAAPPPPLAPPEAAAAHCGGTAGEIREQRLSELPAPAMYVGRTPLTLTDIRTFNSVQAQEYVLHDNDCRHYVNNLVRYSTGVEAATQHAKRTNFRQRSSGGWAPHGWLVELGQTCTDIGNWSKIQGGAAAAALAVVTRRTGWVHVRGAAVALPLPGALKSVPALLPAVATAALVERPLGVACARGGGSDAGGVGLSSALGRLGEQLASGARGTVTALRRAALSGAAGSGGGAASGGARAVAAVGVARVRRAVLRLGASAARATGAMAASVGRRVGALMAGGGAGAAAGWGEVVGGGSRGRSGSAPAWVGELQANMQAAMSGMGPPAPSVARLVTSSGRQTLHLPVPRLALMGQRSGSTAMIARH